MLDAQNGRKRATVLIDRFVWYEGDVEVIRDPYYPVGGRRPTARRRRGAQTRWLTKRRLEMMGIQPSGTLRADQDSEPFELDGYVYVAHMGGFYKIGKSQDQDARIKDLKTQMPYPLEPVCRIPCENHSVSERALHKEFQAERMESGEWFDLSWNDIRWLERIVRMRGDVIVLEPRKINRHVGDADYR